MFKDSLQMSLRQCLKEHLGRWGLGSGKGEGWCSFTLKLPFENFTTVTINLLIISIIAFVFWSSTSGFMVTYFTCQLPHRLPIVGLLYSCLESVFETRCDTVFNTLVNSSKEVHPRIPLFTSSVAWLNYLEISMLRLWSELNCNSSKSLLV